MVRVVTALTYQDLQDEYPANVEIARAWALGAGWRVFPCEVRYGRKRPRIKDWPLHATVSPEQITWWWLGSNFAPSNPEVGICTGPESGIWVLDVDYKGGRDGYARLRQLWDQHGALPDGFRVRTPSGGMHIYFRHPREGEGRIVHNTKPWPEIDVKGDRGFVVAPRTKVREGEYEILGPGGWRGDHPIPDAPEWLLELVTQEPPPPREVDLSRVDCQDTRTWALEQLDALGRRLEGTGAGGRNTELNNCALRAGGIAAHGVLSEEEARVMLLGASDVNGLAGDDGADQCLLTFRSGWEAGLRSPASLPDFELLNLVRSRWT